MTVKLYKQNLIEIKTLPSEIKEKMLAREDHLDLVGMVVASEIGLPFDPKIIDSIQVKLKNEAEKLGADYVFGVEFKAMVDRDREQDSCGTMIYGDAYRIIR